MSRFGIAIFGTSTFGSVIGSVAASAVLDGPALSPVGFGGIWFTRIFRDTSSGSLPDWAPHPRLARFPVPGGGTVVQNLGYDPDTLELRIEVEDSDDAASLRAIVGTEATLILPDDVWAEGGVYEWTVDSGYRSFSSVLLADLVPDGIQLWGGVWFTCSFERARA